MVSPGRSRLCHHQDHCQGQPNVVLDDLMQGIGEWRNIQDIVRVTFKAFQDVLRAQGDAIKTLERVIDTKVSRTEITSALASKANAPEMVSRITQMEKSVSDKLSEWDTKEIRAEMMRLGGAIAAIRDETARHAASESYSSSKALANKVDRIELQHLLAEKADKSQVSRTMAELKADTAALDAAHDTLRDELTEVAQRAGCVADRQAAEAVLKGRLEDLAGTIKTVEVQVVKNSAACKDGLSQRPDRAELSTLLKRQADSVDCSSQALQKADLETSERLTALQVQHNDLARCLRNLQGAVGEKAMHEELELKAGTADVNKALVDVCTELDQKVPLSGLQAVLQEQADVNASLAAVMSLGRWFWRTGKPRAGRVPWNVQAANDEPDNMLWEQDKATITIVSAGLYELSFGVYARKRPVVSLLVNGEAVLAAVNSSSYAVHHSSGRLAPPSTPHPAGAVTGVTGIDFLSLPSKARVALTYQGEERGDGFLSIKRL